MGCLTGDGARMLSAHSCSRVSGDCRWLPWRQSERVLTMEIALRGERYAEEQQVLSLYGSFSTSAAVQVCARSREQQLTPDERD